MASSDSRISSRLRPQRCAQWASSCSRRLMGTAPPSAAAASRASLALKTRIWCITSRMSAVSSGGTLSVTSNASTSPKLAIASRWEVVAMTTTPLPSLAEGASSLASSACSAALLYAGPTGDHCTWRSRSSSTITLFCERPAVLKSAASAVAWPSPERSASAASESAVATCTSGKLLAAASVAASALFPTPRSPSSSRHARGERPASTCSINASAAARSLSKVAPRGNIPSGRSASSCDVCAPWCGVTSASARSKSAALTAISASSGRPRPAPCTPCVAVSLLSGLSMRSSANDAAERHTPSSSAPEKFCVRAATAPRSTSSPRKSDSRMPRVWMSRICARPRSSGRPTSMSTSRRPGRSRAESSSSRRLVMPMMSTLFSADTPSILVSSWLTMVSCIALVDELEEPRCLQMASISSNMMTWRFEFSP